MFVVSSRRLHRRFVERKRIGRPLPDVADQLLHAADADAAGKLVDAHRAARARAPQVGPAAVHRFAPRIAPLQQRMACERHRPTAGLDPFGVGRQSLAGPARIGRRLVPADAHHRMIVLAARIAPVAPESRTRMARSIDEVEHGRPDFRVPDGHLLVAAAGHEMVELCVGDRIAIEVVGLDVQRHAAVIGRLAFGHAVLGDVLQHHVALGHQAHAIGQRRARSRQLFDRQISDQLRPQQQRIAALRQHFVDERLCRPGIMTQRGHEIGQRVSGVHGFRDVRLRVLRKRGFRKCRLRQRRRTGGANSSSKPLRKLHQDRTVCPSDRPGHGTHPFQVIGRLHEQLSPNAKKARRAIPMSSLICEFCFSATSRTVRAPNRLPSPCPRNDPKSSAAYFAVRAWTRGRVAGSRVLTAFRRPVAIPAAPRSNVLARRPRAASVHRALRTVRRRDAAMPRARLPTPAAVFVRPQAARPRSLSGSGNCKLLAQPRQFGLGGHQVAAHLSHFGGRFGQRADLRAKLGQFVA